MQYNDQLTRLAEFMHEAGQLRFLPRSGYAFLGSGEESVAEHSFRAAIIGYALAKLSNASPEYTAMLCLIHDLGETRIGDQNYITRRYVSSRERDAVRDALDGTGLESALMRLWDEQDQRHTQEAVLARDADQLDLLLNLKRELDLGNANASAWIDDVQKRIVSDQGKLLAEKILSGHHTDWQRKAGNG
jgi:putative hydrolase of HD superfamily